MRGKYVDRVEPGSIAEELEIQAGDLLLAVDGRQLQDILDWQLAESSEELVLTIRHQTGETVDYEIEKDYDERIGLVFVSPTLDKIRVCRNRCLFCFVDQMPSALRDTLYIKDDDYRLSFLSGSYITLTNLQEEDILRIIRLHLSPLYVSVHATDPKLRIRLMRNPHAGELLSVMKRLADAGIEFHTQVVLCPGLNDGAALERTISDLYALHPAVLSLAVVPVGLTGHRSSLTPLTASGRSHASQVIATINSWQQRALGEHVTRFVFASDEFYTTAGLPVPPAETYEDYPQLENGVGLVRLLLNEWDSWLPRLPDRLAQPCSAVVATGLSAAGYLEPVISRLNQIQNLSVRLIPVQNHFFGGQVTVAGLLTYQDLLQALRGVSSTLYLPSVMLKESKELFLDGYTIYDLAAALQADVRPVGSLTEFLEDLLSDELR